MARAPRQQPEEERPPHDALEGIALPRQTTVLVGHRAAERALLDAYRSGRMHHAWILAGERGIGKATLAFRLARFLFVNPDPSAPEVAAAADLAAPLDHPAVHRLAAGAHGNMLHLQREWNEKTGRYRTELLVESIRRIGPFLGSSAAEGGWRIVIVDPADDMSVSAANAILKSLEEPPRQTLFLLIAERRGALLPTILSRSRVLPIEPLSADETVAVVRNVAPDVAEGRDAALAAALAAGSPRRFIELAQHDGVEIYRLMRRAIEARDRAAQFKLAAAQAGSGATRQFLAQYEGYLSRRLRRLPEPDGAVAPAPPLVTLAALWEKAALAWREVETYNLDNRQFVLDLLETAAAAFHPAERPTYGNPATT